MDYNTDDENAVYASLNCKNSWCGSYFGIIWPLMIVFTESQFCLSFRRTCQQFIFILSKLYEVLEVARTVIIRLQQNLPKWRDDASTYSGTMGLFPYQPEIKHPHYFNTQETTSNLLKGNSLPRQNLVEISGENIHKSNFLSTYPISCRPSEDSEYPNQILRLQVHSKATHSKSLTEIDRCQNHSLMPMEKYAPLVEICRKEKDNLRKNPSTPSELNRELRRRILEKLANTPIYRRRRCAAELLQKEKNYKRLFQNSSTTNNLSLLPDEAPFHNLSDTRQLFVRKRWGPVMDLSAFIYAKHTPKCNRKQWGPIADPNMFFYPHPTVQNNSRKKWGPITDLGVTAKVPRKSS